MGTGDRARLAGDAAVPRRHSPLVPLALGTGDLAIIDQPAGSAAWLTPAQELILPALVVFSLSFIGRQVASFGRSSGERRQQLRLLSGALVSLFGAAVVVLVPALDTHLSAIAQPRSPSVLS